MGWSNLQAWLLKDIEFAGKCRFQAPFWTGALITAGVALSIETSRQAGAILPIPFILLSVATFLSASIGGLKAGLLSTAVWAAYVTYAATVPFGPPTLTGSPGEVSLGILVILLVVLREGVSSDRTQRLTQALKSINETLEEQVRSRTAELSATNAQLRQEIKERCRVETELRRSEAQSRAIFAAVPDLMLRVGADGVYRKFLNQHLDFDLLSQEVERTGLSLVDVLPAEIAERKLHYLQKALQTGELQVYEQRIQVGDRWQDEEVRIMKSGEDEVLFMIRNISDLKQAEAERLQAEKFRLELKLMEQIFEIILAGYWDWDIPNHQEYLSPGFKRMFGYADHELPDIPESWQNLVFPEDLPSVLECFDRHVQSRGEIPYYNEVRYRHKDGSTVWVICSGQVIEWDDAGNPLRMIGCHIDISGRKQIEAQLIALTSLNQAILDSANYSIISTTETGVIQTFNAAAEAMLGYAASEIINQATPELIHDPEEVRQRAEGLSAELGYEIAPGFEVFVAKARQDIVTETEWTYIRKDGSRFPASLSVTALRDNWGELTGFLGIAKDITEQKQAEEQLRKSDAHLKTAQRIGKLGSWEFDLQTGEIQCSEEVFRIFDHDPQVAPLNCEALNQYLHPDDREHYEQTVQMAIETAQPYEIELRIYRPNGALVYLQVREEPVLDAAGRLIQLVGTVLDITDRKQAEAAIQESEARFRYVADHAPVLIWMSEGDKRCSHFNKVWLEFTGRTIEQEQGNGWAEGVHPDDLQFCLDTYTHAFDTRQKFEMEYRLRRFDGEYRWVLDTGIPRYDGNGEFLGYIGSCIDISDRKQAEAQIRQHTAELEVSNRELEAFAYSVSHDLRAPLRAIDAYSKALLDEYGDTFEKAGQDHLDRIRNNVARMSQLIDDLLNLSRISRAAIRYTPVNLSVLAQELITDLQASETERQVDIVITPNVVVSADAALMRVVLTNLLHNAWKFTRRHSTARIEFGVIDSEEQPTYFIRDDGAGFNMAYAKKLFGVFQRLHTIHEFPGTGIGLATVQRVIQRHGGRIWAEGAVEQGATFYFTLENQCSLIPVETRQ
ncbi:MAG: PAS domain S-box protein [Leptolyngbyaceae cyanobacterium MO_188.B28]|nr:PAS domain S-box protein [Leptolyngbyaceae cyanobacterium MO_188.B28]